MSIRAPRRRWRQRLAIVAIRAECPWWPVPPRAAPPAKRRPSTLAVEVVASDTPIDFDAWVRQYVTLGVEIVRTKRALRAAHTPLA